MSQLSTYVAGAFCALVVACSLGAINLYASNTVFCEQQALSPRAALTYAPATNLFSVLHEQLVAVVCGETALLSVGSGGTNQYIYQRAYQRVDGAWKRVRLNGKQEIGPWILGSAQAEISLPETGSTGSVLVYVCQYVQNTWKCGCRDTACVVPQWQRFDFLVQSGIPAVETATSSTEDDVPVGIDQLRYIEETFRDLLKTQGNDKMTRQVYDAIQAVLEEAEAPLQVHQASTGFAKPGTKVTLTGSGFPVGGSVSVLWGDLVVSGVVEDAQTVSVVTPTLSPGRYLVTVRTNEHTAPRGVTVWIGNGGAAPKIDHILPTSGQYGDTFVLSGTGFTDLHQVITELGAVAGSVSDDGTALSFRLNPLAELLGISRLTLPSDTTYTLHVTLVTPNGVSNTVEITLTP